MSRASRIAGLQLGKLEAWLRLTGGRQDPHPRLLLVSDALLRVADGEAGLPVPDPPARDVDLDEMSSPSTRGMFFDKLW